MNSDMKNDVKLERISIDEAINNTGFGLYSCFMTCMTGICVIAFTCLGYGATFVVPTSACELNTTVHQQGILAAGPVIGLILGAFCWGYLADTRGRRPMLLFCLIGATAFNLIATISVNWIMLFALQFVAALFASGIFSIAMCLLSESVPAAKKNVILLLVTSIFLLGQGTMALMALPIIPLRFSYYLPALGIYWNSWRLLMVMFCVPSMLSAVCLFFMQESPKFAYAKGDEERTLQILKAIHRINHLWSKEELPVQSLLMEETVASAAKATAGEQIAPLFKAPHLKYLVIMIMLFVSDQMGSFIVWLPTIADRFVRILESGDSSNLTMCGILNIEPAPTDPDATPCALNETSLFIVLGIGVVLSIVNLCVSLSINAFGARKIVVGLTSVCGLSGILVNLVPNVIGSAVLFIIMLQAFIAVGLYTALVVSLFPTHLRTMAMALGQISGRVGTFAAIQILKLLLVDNCDAGFYLFASIFAASGIAALFLPDDRQS